MQTAESNPTIRVTSEGFTPGWDCDRRIADLLRVPVSDEVPRYCDRPELTRELLQARCEVVFSRFDDSGVSRVLFTHLDGFCVASGASEAHALASALLCSLEERPKV